MKNAFEYEAELTALREELVNLQEAVNSAAIDIPAGVEIAKVPGIIAGRLTAAERRNAIMTKALERITRPHDCGCVPCTGSCTSKYALEIALEEIREIAGAALKPTGAIE